MSKYRFCSGLAIAPERDMKLLSEMSRSGYHFSGFSWLLMYRFEKGEPAPYIYSLNMENSVSEDMLSMYRESGWEPIVAENGYQIFRALEGTPPIFSDKESQIDVLKTEQKRCGRCSLIFFIVTFLCILAIKLLHITNALFLLVIIPLTCFIYTFFPFVGLTLNIRRINKKE